MMADANGAAASPERRRILFSVRNFWFLKYYDSVLHALAARGHAIHVLGDREDMDRKFPEWMTAIETLSAEYPDVTYGWVPPQRKSLWDELADWVRRLSDYVRFLEPQFDRAPILRRRANRHATPTVRRIMEGQWPGRRLVVRLTATILRALERTVSPTDHIDAVLRWYRPDLVIVSPLITLGSRQSEVVRAARHAGVRSVFAVGSWDHLSSKARVRELPDAVLVWNATQRREAVEFHGVPHDRVIVTGAQCFDQWFGRSPSRDRQAFCRDVGLPDDRPIVFYVCSSLFWGSPVEADFVGQWVEALRSSRHESLRRASILVRPHPKRGEEWKQSGLTRFDDVAVWPPFGEPPLNARAKADYFDSLFHADAIVGLNTSAQIEGALIGRPVFTILLPEFWDNQEGTLHFRYLLAESGGPLRAARSLAEHVDQLADGIADPAASLERNRAFVTGFVRPHGLDRPATATFVDAVERLAGVPSSRFAAARASLATFAVRAVTWPVACLLLVTPAGNGRARRNTKARRREASSELGGSPLRRTSKAKVTAPAAAAVDSRPREEPTGPAWDGASATLPNWAWTLRGIVYPIAQRLPLGLLSSERIWRAARYRQKAIERDREKALRAAIKRQAPARKPDRPGTRPSA